MPEQISLETIRNSYSAEIEAGSGERNLKENLLHVLTQPRVLRPAIGLGVTVGVFAPGVAEGLAMGMPFEQALVYGIGTTFLSVSRTAYDLNNLVQAVKGGDTQQIDEAVRQAIPHYALEARAVITASVIAASAVNGWQSFRRHSEDRQKAILEGRVKINRSSEQMFLFGGEESQVVNTLSAILGDQALPLFENAKASETILNRIARGRSAFPVDRGGNPQIPVYLDLGVDGAIGYQNSLGWRRLALRQGNLLQNANGKSLLVTYGFGETNEEVLLLTDEPKQDLTVSELLAGTNQLEALAKSRDIKIDRIVRVYLGNARLRRQRHTGSGIKELTDREAATGIDIFVDTRGPLVTTIAGLIGENKRVAFETGRLDYVQGLRVAAAPFGITLYDEENPVEAGEFSAALVHEDNVSDTLEVVSNLKRRKIYSKVIALTPTLWAHERAIEKGLESLCVPLVYADLMLEIRGRLRAGEESASIQHDFDQRFPYS